MKALSVDPYVVRHIVEELDQDRRSIHIERTYRALHRMLAHIVEKEVMAKFVTERVECQKKKLVKCYDARRRCWACLDCQCLTTNSLIKMRREWSTLHDSLVDSLVSVEMDMDFMRRRWPA
jgi:transcription initiation factor TFIIIB Brf1 subunit/transcription initiation factor TFIIB